MAHCWVMHGCLSAVILLGAHLPDETLAHVTPTPDEILEIERAMTDARSAIESGRVVVAIRYKIFVADPTLVDTLKRYELFFDREKRRSTLEVTTGGKHYRLHTIFTNDSFIRADDSAGIVQLFGRATRPESALEIPDPRLLGIVAWHFDTISQFGPDKHFLRPDRSDMRIESAIDETEPVLKVTYQFQAPSGTVATEYWLATQKGNVPVYISVSSGAGEQTHSQSLRSKLKLYGSGTWFPEEVEFITKQGEHVLADELATVEEAEFRQSIDAKTFTLEGLELAEGRAVSNDGKLMVWTGNSLAPKISGMDHYQGRQLESNPRPWRAVLLANAAVLAVLGGLLLWLRRRRATKNREDLRTR